MPIKLLAHLYLEFLRLERDHLSKYDIAGYHRSRAHQCSWILARLSKHRKWMGSKWSVVESDVLC